MIVCPGYGITPTISNYAFVEKNLTVQPRSRNNLTCMEILRRSIFDSD
jgi:hypothetical protein